MEGGFDDNQDPEGCLRKAQALIPLLMAEVYCTKVFSGRWQAITAKLEVLNQIITSIIAESSCYWAENLLLKDLIPNVVSTLQEAREHAKRCRELSYSGKLMMQSDLDVVVNKLNCHQRDLDILIKSGLLKEPNDAIAVSSPGPGASRDAPVFFVKGLFARLQIGNTQLKKEALISLVKFLQEDDKNIIAMVDERVELDIGYLVHLLDSHVVTIREHAAIAVSILALSDACKACLAAESVTVIPPLIRLLESGTCLGKEKAAEALQGLTVDSEEESVNVELNLMLGICHCNHGRHINKEHAYAVFAYGGLSALVEFCRNGSPEGKAIGSSVLRNLAFLEEIRDPIAEEGAIPVLINLVNCGTALAQDSSAECLHLLAASHENLRQKICREGGVKSLVLFLGKAPSTSAQEIALRAIHSLSVSICSISLLMSSGFVKHLIILLKCGCYEIQELAALSVCNLSRTDEIKRALREAGCIGLLAKMLDGKPSFSQAIAARALSSLLSVQSNRKEFIKDDVNVSRMVQLLDPQNEIVAKAFPISALLALCRSSRGRRKIACAGACQYLEKLAKMEVGGAKKILHKITTNCRLIKMWNTKWSHYSNLI